MMQGSTKLKFVEMNIPVSVFAYSQLYIIFPLYFPFDSVADAITEVCRQSTQHERFVNSNNVYRQHEKFANSNNVYRQQERFANSNNVYRDVFYIYIYMYMYIAWAR